jgi:DNA-directed RNA polymerase subunit RPC12/RpoP
MTLSERTAYLKGLMEGMELDTETKEGKLFKAIIETLDDMALTVTDLEDVVDAVCDELDSIEEDLDAIEDYLLDEEEDEDEEDEDEDEYDFDDEVIYEVKCPSCGTVIDLDEEMLDAGAIECPDCGEELEFDVDEAEEE